VGLKKNLKNICQEPPLYLKSSGSTSEVAFLIFSAGQSLQAMFTKKNLLILYSVTGPVLQKYMAMYVYMD